jgi:hypothetical protein
MLRRCSRPWRRAALDGILPPRDHLDGRTLDVPGDPQCPLYVDTGRRCQFDPLPAMRPKRSTSQRRSDFDLVFLADFAAEDHAGGLLRDHVGCGVGVG